MTLRKFALLLANLTMIAALVACSSSSSKTTNPITVAFSAAPPASLQVSAQQALTAAVSNDSSASPQVAWSVTCGSAGACGSFSPSTTSSGVSTTYTAPSTVPSGGSVTVTATSVTDNTKSASAAITITGASSSALPDGTYVFSLGGQDAAADYLYYVAGAFTVASGNITGGEQDFTDYFNSVTLSDAITSGTVTTSADGNLQITLNTGDSSVGVSGTETLNATLVSSTGSRALITEFDASATSSGELDLQTSTSAGQGGYAFFLNGGDSNGCGSGIGGVANVDGKGTISGAGSVFDMDDCGTVLQDQPIDSSTVSSSDSFGRIQISLVLSTSGVGGIGLVGYIVDGSRVQLVENANDPNDIFFGVTGGTAFAQGANTGTFNAASVEGSSFVFGGTGQDGSGYLQVAGVVTTNVDGTTINGTLNSNDLTGTAAQAPEAFTGTYTVDSTGRATLNLSLGVTLQLYLTGGNRAYTVAMDTLDEWAGPAHLQTGAGSFTATSFSGNYGFGATGFGTPGSFSGPEFDVVGLASADGTSAVTATIDQNILFGTPAAGLPVTGTFTADPSGIFSDGMTGLDITTSTNADVFTYYMIDTTKAVAIETDPNQLTLGYFELVQ